MTPTPNTQLYLLSNVDLDPNFNYTIDFETPESQQAFFNEKIDDTLDNDTDYSYIRDNETIKVYKGIEDLLGVNYLMYKNDNKWWYAFIVKKEYVSVDTTRIYFKIDPLQSFMFDYELKESFIEREHQDRYVENEATTLRPILNTQDENLEVGEYRFNKQYQVKETLPYNIKYVLWAIVICKDKLLDPEGSNRPIEFKIDNIPTGTYVYCMPVKIVFNDNTYKDYYSIFLKDKIQSGIETDLRNNPLVLSIEYTPYIPFNYTITKTNIHPGGDIALQGPFYIINLEESDPSGDIYYYYLEVEQYTNWSAGYIQLNNINRNKLSKIYDIGNDYDVTGVINKNELSINNLANIKYEPKLLTNPFRQVKALSATDEKIVNTKDYNFTKAKITQLFNLNYSQIVNVNEDINEFTHNDILDAKSNEITLSTDRWLEYENNNKASLRSGLLTNLAITGAQLALGVATGGVGLAVAGATAIGTLGSIANEMIKRKDIQETPDEIRKAGGVFYVNHVKYDNLVTLQIYDTIFKNNIYKFLMQYGYKAREIKTPNTKSRYYYNYIKTIGANIKTNIDSEFKNQLCEIYNNGVTIWHYRNKSTFKGVNNFDYENVEINLIGG